jgi:LPXTG-motif cell wall-anchored protein
VWDMTDPTNPVFATIMQPPAGTDVSPEGMVFIASADSPNGRPLLAVSNEVSGTLSIWALGDAPSAPITLPATGSTLALVGLGLTAASLGLVMVRRGRRDAAMG